MYEEALPYFENALKIAASTPDTGYPFLTNEALLETLIGLERNEAAQRLADNILAHAKQQHRIQQQAIVLNLSAHIARVQKDNHKALSTIQEALLLSETGGFLRETADAQSLLSDIYQEQGDHQRAEQFGTLAAASTQASGDTWSVPSRLQALAELQISRGKYAEADSVYDRAEDFVDSLIGNYSSVLEKTAIIKASSDLFARHFSLVAEKFNNPAKAYSIVEQVRGRVATDLLMAGSFASNEAKRTEKTISELRLKLIGAHSTAEVRRIRDQIFLVEQSRWITPEISILKAQSRERVGIERVQRSLSPSAAILEYVVAEPHSYCLVISYRGSRIVTLTGRHRIEALVMAYLKAVKAKQSAHDEARHLYDALLAPIPTAVQKTDLVVVRDGMLHFVPFDGFMDPIGHYVAEAHMVVYAPSATSFYLLATQRSPRRVASRALLAVGGVPHNGGESKQASITRGYNPEGFIDLPASKDEVLAAEAAVHSPGDRLLLGLDATESAFKQSSLSRYRIIHLAVHGLPSMIDPNRAALVLLSDPPAGEDGFLQASEIVQLRLNAELVVLSACDTAVGPVEGEEGIATLARAFLLSGARTVISTLWSIDDTFSFYLMKQFYKHLTAQEPPAHALAAAKRDMLGKYGSKAVPYYWAGFSFEGAADGVISRKEGRQTSHVTEPTSAR
jgi:CHAT domain-containing protein